MLRTQIAAICRVIFVSLLTTPFTQATASKNKLPLSNQVIAIQILKKYNKVPAVEMKTVKKVSKATLGTKTQADGVLVYSKNKIHFITQQPTQTEIIYNKNVWVIEYPDLELDEKAARKVTMFESSKVPFVKSIAELLSAPEKFFDKETIIKDQGGLLTIETNKIKNTSIKKFSVVLDKKNQVISSLLLTDDLNTDTAFLIQKTEFLKKVPKNLFSYKKMKTDEILKP